MALLTLSCAQDEGNYVYRELDEPVITGLADAQVLTFERLLVEPGLGDVAEAIMHMNGRLSTIMERMKLLSWGRKGFWIVR